jgi:hypothetical protein
MMLLVACGCRTVPNENVATFASAVTAEKSHSHDVFATVDELIAAASLDYAATQPTLTEANFTSGLSQNGLQLWEEAFEKLERYGQHLQTLTSPELAKGFEDESVQLAGQLQAFGEKLHNEGLATQAPKFNPTIAAGFAELGSLFIRLKAQSDARRILEAADPHVRSLLLEMAASIGGSTAEGVRGTVKTHWNTLLAQQKQEFLEATSTSDKKTVAAAFLETLEKRAAQDMALISLRRALLALADLHHALVRGEAWTARKSMEALSQEMTRTEQISIRMREGTKP